MSRATFARALWSGGIDRHQAELDLLERLIARYQDRLARMLDDPDAEYATIYRAGAVFSQCLDELKIRVLPGGKVSIGQ